MGKLSCSKNKLGIILIVIVAVIFLIAVPFAVLRFTQSEEVGWEEWEKMAVDFLRKEEEISQRYDDTYTFTCTKAHYGYVNGEDMYDEDGELLPTDITLTIVVYKGTMASPLNRDLFLVYLLRNDDGTYYVDSYKARS